MDFNLISLKIFTVCRCYLARTVCVKLIRFFTLISKYSLDYIDPVQMNIMYFITAVTAIVSASRDFLDITLPILCRGYFQSDARKGSIIIRPR
jgi:hypothetical protein